MNKSHTKDKYEKYSLQKKKNTLLSFTITENC